MTKLSKEEILGELQFNWRNPHEKSSKHWKRNQQAYNQIVAFIKKEVTEEWIKEKIVELDDVWAGKITEKDFIRSLVEEGK